MTSRNISTSPFNSHPAKTDWRGLFRLYAFFFYFSGVTHVILQLMGATVFVGLRQAIVMSLLWLIPVLLFPQRTKAISALIGAVLWLFSLVNLGYFCIYQQEFSQSVIFIIFESNPAESAEFVSQYFVWWMIPVLLLHTTVAIWLWHRLRPVILTSKKVTVISLAILSLLFFYPLFKQLVLKQSPLPVALEKIQNNMEPAVPWQLVMGYVNYKTQLNNMEKLLEQNSKIPPLKNLQDVNADVPATLVLVIGESTNRQHLSLYGYHRKTTPLLDAMRDQLTIFNHVVTSRPSTIEALQQVLTFADQDHPDRYLTEPSLMNLMKQAGYKTFWITNQQTVTKRNTMLTTFAKHTDKQIFLNNTRSQNSEQYDENVLPPFAEVLKDKAPRKFIVVHLLGTHLKYQYRYPAAYDYFNTREGLPSALTEAKAEVVNTYDNAVLYNDFVVSSLIEQLKTAVPNGLLLYLSDHGEDVYDSPPYNMLGRNEYSPTLPMYAIPFFLWESPARKSTHPRNWSTMLNRTYSTADFIYTWSDLAGLRYDGFDARKSLVSDEYQAMPLKIGNPYDKKSLTVLAPE
ncbi:MAG: phosphoethanolamine transferase CptA [Methylotenera sp.]|nr:phosphoethanolamine transferase CptA [Methylotenera sp.]